MNLSGFIPGGWVAKALAVAVVLAAAFAGGYKVGTWRAGAAATVAAQRAADAAKAQLERQQADAKARDDAAFAALIVQQERTSAYLKQRDAIAAAFAQYQLEIAHVHYTTHAPAPVAGACPASPVDSPEFVRYYDAAATGAAAAASSGGVPQGALAVPAANAQQAAAGLPLPAGRDAVGVLVPTSH